MLRHFLCKTFHVAARWALPLLVAAIVWCPAAECRTVELTVHQLPNFSAQDVGSKSESAVVRRFLELHPEVRLKRGTGMLIEGKTQDMIPLMQIAGDISPDVIYVNFRLSETYIENGFLKPLDQYISSIDEEELDRRVPPAVRDICYRTGPDGKKHWYMLPTEKLVRVLVYRRDLFAAAGLDPDRPPRTWKELQQYSERLTDHTKGRYGIGFHKGDESAWDFANLVWSRGGSIVSKNERGEWHPTFNTPETADALYFYLKMSKQRVKGSNGRYYRGLAFRDTGIDIADPLGSSAMTFSYLGSRLNVYQPQMLGYAPVPYPEGKGRSRSEINCPSLGVFAGVSDPAVAKAAFDYIAFLDSDEANSIRAKIYIQRGCGKFVNPEILERFGYKDYLKQVDREWVRVYKDALVNGKPEPYGKNCALIYRELSRPIEQALNDKTALAALDRGDEAAVKKRLRAILERAQQETQKRMYDRLPPAVRKLRHNLTVLFLVLTGAVFSLAGFVLIRHFGRSAPEQMPGHKRSLAAYIILLPALASVGLWQYYPLLKGTIIAFQDYNVMGDVSFAGVKNFSTVLFDPGFWRSLYTTLVYTALYMTFAFGSPIALALLLSEVPRGKMLFRTLFYLPAVLSGLVVMFLWKSFYKPTGLLNTMLGSVGLHLNTNWLDTPALAMAAVLIPVIWAGMGPGCLIYLAAFKTIPDEFYEAAEVDGAGITTKVFRITLPSIKMLILINAVGAFIGAFMTSEMIFAMTGGGPYTPYGATEVVGLQLFYTAFMYLKFGVATAMAWVLGFMLIGLTMMQLKNLSRVEFKGGR